MGRVLQTTGQNGNGSRRFAGSNLALLIDDLKHLPGIRAKFGLLVELFFPPADTLFRKYGSRSRLLLPYFYLRHIMRGLSERLTLH